MNLNIDMNNDDVIQRYLALMSSFNFLSAITKPTHFNESNTGLITGTILDHIFLNGIRPSSSFVFDLAISDHCGTCLLVENLDCNITSHSKSKIISRPYSESNLNTLKSKLDSTNWNTLLSNHDANTQYEIFTIISMILSVNAFQKRLNLFLLIIKITHGLMTKFYQK